MRFNCRRGHLGVSIAVDYLVVCTATELSGCGTIKWMCMTDDLSAGDKFDI